MIRPATITPPPSTDPQLRGVRGLGSPEWNDRKDPEDFSGFPGASLLDRSVALLLLILAAPLIGILYVLVRMTSAGPGLYSQRRVGLRGKEFRIYKLRTMTWDCERHTGAVWAKPQDPRVTRIGYWLRKTHLDELPQLWNVVRGDMSLVGPRPERQEIMQRLVPQIPEYPERLKLMPGVTGLAQVCTHADQTIQDVELKLAYDLVYLERRSLSLDARIVLCTGLKVLHLNSQGLRQRLFGDVLNHPRLRHHS
ncbi:MAG: sugar transferase [Planctomycetales bacterium]